MRNRLWLFVCAALAVAGPAEAFNAVSVGGTPKTFDTNVHFIGEFGKVEPSERSSTFQKANIKIVTGGVGYAFGRVGPLADLYVRIEGAYFTSAAERVQNSEDDLPLGREFFPQDRGGWVSATVSANFIHEPRFSFGAYLQGTVPIGVNLEKFSNPHIHYAGGGPTVGVFITPPQKLVRLGFSARVFFGSGAYEGGFAHNAVVSMTNLFALEFERWALPWRAGLFFGPFFEGDLNQHVNDVYRGAYGSVSPDLVKDDRVRAVRFAIAVLPYFKITDHAAIELGYVQKLFGYDAIATQFWTGGMRTTF